jgi:hypothetical protein
VGVAVVGSLVGEGDPAAPLYHSGPRGVVFRAPLRDVGGGGRAWGWRDLGSVCAA